MNNKRILVVEDNEMNMKLVRSLLELSKFRVLQAEDAEMGIQIAEQASPDLILMDIQLPGMDGLEATRHIKKIPALADVPIIALTSHAMRGDEKKAKEAGCNGYITKPINTRTFIGELSSFFKIESSEVEQKRLNAEMKQSQMELTCSQKPRILVVDDEHINVKLMQAILSSEQLEIVPAYDGETALQRVLEYPIDLVLLDIMMPNMDGYEVAQRIKQNPKTKDIPVIMVTALNGREDKIKALKAGADEFLTKPVNRIEILTRVRSMLQFKLYHEQLNIRIKSETSLSGLPLEQDKQQENTYCKGRILLVEDNEKDIKLFESILQTESYEYILARSGEEAIDIALQQSIDVIILDILLPGMNGFEVCKYLKNNKLTCDIQIVITTCLNDLESKLKGVEEGVDEFLVKPIDSRELRSRINVLIKKKSYIDKLHSHSENALSLAISDGLTRMYNKAYLNQYLELELKRSVEYGYPIAVAMMDLDNFKKCNDSFGHSVGDFVLIEFAKIIRENLREIDLPARYGGEEFTIVFPYAEKTIILEILNKIREDLARHSFKKSDFPSLGMMTVSIGLAFSSADICSADELIEKADYMLYRAKRSGKNKICS